MIRVIDVLYALSMYICFASEGISFLTKKYILQDDTRYIPVILYKNVTISNLFIKIFFCKEMQKSLRME